MSPAKAFALYQHKLATLPKPGGNGCHSALLGVANLGIMAGLSQERILSDIRQSIPAGGRTVPDSEIMAAIQRAAQDAGDHRTMQRPPPVRPMFPDPMKARLEFIEKGRALSGVSAAGDLKSAFYDKSAVRLGSGSDASDAVLLLENLYAKDEKVFIGKQYDGKASVRSVGEWISIMDQAAKAEQPAAFPYLIINPLTGLVGLTKGGKESYRADSCVAAYRFLLGEFDGLPLEDQLAFWAGFPAPIAALTFSGGKSVHALIRVDCADRAEWEADVEQKLFGKILRPMGIDSSCRNEARLSRLPGHFRADKQQWQRLLYLNPRPSMKGVFA